MRSEVVALQGGNKQKYIRQHYAEIKEYYFAHGGPATMEEFNLRETTLDAVLLREHRYDRLNRLNKDVKLVFELCMDSDRDILGRVFKLEGRVDAMEPPIELLRGLIHTIDQLRQAQGQGSIIQVVKQDALSLADFGGKSGK